MYGFLPYLYSIFLLVPYFRTYGILLPMLQYQTYVTEMYQCIIPYILFLQQVWRPCDIIISDLYKVGALNEWAAVNPSNQNNK